MTRLVIVFVAFIVVGTNLVSVDSATLHQQTWKNGEF